MSAEEEQSSNEKPYEPSQRRLEEARRKGEVPRSMDLTAAAAYGGFLLACVVFGGFVVERTGTSLTVMLDRAETLSALLLADGGRSLAGSALAAVALGLLPLLLLPGALAIVSVVAQRAFTVAPEKLSPKLNRISLITNMKNKFGRVGLFEFTKSFVKLVVISVLLGIFLSLQLPDMLASVMLSPGPAVALMARLSIAFLTVVVVISAVIGAIDYLWQRAEHMRRHRMSHKEMTDEMKQTEGDPFVKQKRRERGHEIATNRMMADVPKADVIVVNPEHFAVALRWARTRGSAPVCVAKGVDAVAARIRATAGAAGVPIHRDPPTARALHATVEIGHEIRREHYAAVASAIRFADRIRSEQKRRR